MTSLSFQPISWWLFLLVILVWLVGVVLEWKKESRFRPLRLLAMGLVLLALCGLLLRPGIEVAQSHEFILLTRGYSTSTVEELMRKNPDLGLVRLESAEPFQNAELVAESFLTQHSEQIAFIAGSGLSSAQLEVMKNPNFEFLAGEVEGITALQIPEQIFPHELTEITGTVTSGTSTKLVLSGPEGKVDSATIQAGKSQPLRLKFRARVAGKMHYELELHQGKVSKKEIIPIVVKEVPSMQVLMLQNFPTAEVKFLKQFLTQGNHSLVVRSKISQTAFTYEYLQHAAMEIPRLTEESLTNFDLVVATEKALEQLSGSERSNLKRKLQSGLGLVILMESGKGLMWLGESTFVPAMSDTIHLKSSTKELVLPVAGVIPGRGARWIPAAKSVGISGAGYKLIGAGKVAYVAWQESYKLALEGKAMEYAELWSPVLKKAVRKEDEFVWQQQPLFPLYSNEPIDITITAPEPILYTDSVPVPLKEELVVDDVWRGRIWADEPGWHHWMVGSAKLPYYVFEAGSWASLREVQNLETTRAVAVHTRVKEKQVSASGRIMKEFPELFFVLFILAAGVLWFVPKV